MMRAAIVTRQQIQPMQLNNEIALGEFLPSGVSSAYVGTLACKAQYSNAMQKTLNILSQSVRAGTTKNRAWVFESKPDGFVLRTGQHDKYAAEQYIRDQLNSRNFVLVYIPNSIAS